MCSVWLHAIHLHLQVQKYRIPEATARLILMLSNRLHLAHLLCTFHSAISLESYVVGGFDDSPNSVCCLTVRIWCCPGFGLLSFPVSRAPTCALVVPSRHCAAKRMTLFPGVPTRLGILVCSLRGLKFYSLLGSRRT